MNYDTTFLKNHISDPILTTVSERFSNGTEMVIPVITLFNDDQTKIGIQIDIDNRELFPNRLFTSSDFEYRIQGNGFGFTPNSITAPEAVHIITHLYQNQINMMVDKMNALFNRKQFGYHNIIDIGRKITIMVNSPTLN